MTEHTHQSPQLHQCLPARALDDAQCLPCGVHVTSGDASGGARLDHHHTDTVSNHVVELARHPVALLLSISRTGWIIYALVEVVLFVVANVTAKNASHPGTVSQAFFLPFVAGLVLAVVLALATLVRQRRTAR